MYSGELNVFPVTLIKERPKSDLECGGKIVLPPSVLEVMTSRNNQLSGPMAFKLTNVKTGAFTHSGVLEFIAEEGTVNVPSWVLDLLQLAVNDKVRVSSVSLPTASYVRFQPQCTQFLEISNPKAVLENYLRAFSCLTENDIIPIFYNDHLYNLKVEETKPQPAVGIHDCDTEVDFSPPVGYVPPKPPVTSSSSTSIDQSKPFPGQGQRADGKVIRKPPVDEQPQAKRRRKTAQGIPDYDWKFGTLDFPRDPPSQ